MLRGSHEDPGAGLHDGIPRLHRHLRWISGTQPHDEDLWLNDIALHDKLFGLLRIRRRGGASHRGAPWAGPAAEPRDDRGSLTSERGRHDLCLSGNA